jgi:beta-phosphoglucomutase-like phosphatase (HAD superfamily)
VASSTGLARLKKNLEFTGLAPLFGDHIYSASQVARGKPAPDVFLLAAERLGVDPRQCWAFEDSPAGVQAARAAGCRVHVLPPDHLSSEQRQELYPETERFLSSLEEIVGELQ